MPANFTEKGQYAFDMALKHFKNRMFSAAELSEACGEKIVAATLNGIVNHGYMFKEAGTPVKFGFVEDIDLLIAMDMADVKKGPTKAGLENAKHQKNNEFYTMMSDVEEECFKYKSYYRGKSIFCNCNDGLDSNFFKYFMKNFDAFGLTRLVGISYEENGQGVKYIIDDSTEVNADGEIDESKVTMIQLNGNGGFETEESLEELKKCDIVITNPPFSEFRRYVDLLITHNKKFLIIGNNNAISSKEIFTHMMNEKIWLGYSSNKNRDFVMPDSYVSDRIDENGRKIGTVSAISWYTNLPVRRFSEPLILTATYHTDTNRRESYDFYDTLPNVINVNRVENIPKDYSGIMGVPITYIGKHCPEQFELIGLMASTKHDEINHGYPYINGVKKYARVLIKRKTMDDSYL